MIPVLFLKGCFKIFDELVRITSVATLQKEALARRGGLLVKLPNIARNASTPRRPFSGIGPSLSVHSGCGDSRAKYENAGPVRKLQPTHLRHCFRSAPDDGAVHCLRHGFVKVGPRMIETRHENTLSHHTCGISLAQPFYHAFSYIHQTAWHSHQTTIPSQQSAGHRQDGLNLYISRGPVADHSQRKCPQLCAPVLPPATVQHI